MNNKIKRVRSGDYLTNSYYIFDGRGNALIIDPGCSFEKSKEVLNGNVPVMIVLTHGHLDHTYDCNLFVYEYGSRVFIHENDNKYLNDIRYSSPDGLSPKYEFRSMHADVFLGDGESFSFGNDTFTVIHTPGHTEGSCCFFTEGVLFSGDTLFRGSIGRTDFPFGCSDEDMKNSLRKLKKMLPEDTVILPGHGFNSNMSYENTNNPYLYSL